MSETTNWTGLLSGARTGAVTVEITRDGTHMTGSLRSLESGVGELHSRFVGQWTADNKLSAHTVEYFSGNSGGGVTVPQTGKMEGMFDARENIITGRWSSEADPLGEFRWIHAGNPKSARTLAGITSHVGRYYERFASGAKMLFEKSGFTWEKRYNRWLLLALQLALVGLAGFVLVAVVIDFVAGN
jgi:hypothetical protein